jgi:hypothetical protein
MPDEFDDETAMGLFANISAIESAQALTFARAVAMAFGDGDGIADAIYAVTGNARLARNIKIRAAMRRDNANG